MPLDDFLPIWDFREQHQTRVQARPERVFQTLLEMDLRRSPLVGLLYFLRQLPQRLRGGAGESLDQGKSLEGMLRMGFIALERREGRELVLGLVGRPWGLAPELLRLPAAEFVGFDQPGLVKVATNFLVEPLAGHASRLSTETRIQCLGPEARRLFRRYWWAIRPGSGLIRREILRLVRQEAQRRAA